MARRPGRLRTRRHRWVAIALTLLPVQGAHLACRIGSCAVGSCHHHLIQLPLPPLPTHPNPPPIPPLPPCPLQVVKKGVQSNLLVAYMFHEVDEAAEAVEEGQTDAKTGERNACGLAGSKREAWCGPAGTQARHASPGAAPDIKANRNSRVFVRNYK